MLFSLHNVSLFFTIVAVIMFCTLASSIAHSDSRNISYIYYINMDTSLDRRQHMETILAPLDIPFERVPCIKISGKQHILDEYVVNQGRKFCEYPHFKQMHSFTEKPGAVSLYFTVKHIVDKVCSGNVKGAKSGDLVLVLEDDVELDPEWRLRFKNSMSTLPHLAPNWTLARFGSWGEQRTEDKINEYWHRVSQPLFVNTWPPQYFYHGILALLIEVGPRTQPLCDLMTNGEVCWVSVMET